MNKITAENLIEILKEKFPKFIPDLESHIENFGPDGIIIKMNPFGKYIINTLKQNNEKELKNIFDLIEILYSNGDEDVQTALTTGLLEYLMHQDPKEVKFSEFCKYLGQNAWDYCRAWDEFNGVKTEGLW